MTLMKGTQMSQPDKVYSQRITITALCKTPTWRNAPFWERLSSRLGGRTVSLDAQRSQW